MTAILTILTGFAGGLVVGASVTAFFTVLGVVARIIEFGKTKQFIRFYEIGITTGAVLSSVFYISDISMSLNRYLVIGMGLAMGIFIGLIAAALTETLDILSTAAKTLDIVNLIYILVIIVLLGKIFGSIVFWMVPGFF